MRYRSNQFFIIPLGLFLIIPVIYLIYYYQQSQLQSPKQQEVVTTEGSFHLKGPVSINKAENDFIIRIIPRAEFAVTKRTTINTVLKFTKNNAGKDYGDGLVIGNMLPGDNNRQLRLYYYKPDQNWALEYTKGIKPEFFFVASHPIENGQIVPIALAISQDGRKVDIKFLGSEVEPVSINLPTSLLEVTNNMFLGLFLTKGTTGEILMLNSFLED